MTTVSLPTERHMVILLDGMQEEVNVVMDVTVTMAAKVDVMVSALGEVGDMNLDTVKETPPSPQCEEDRVPH